MKEKNPSISILVPCYNEEKTIRDCVLSWLDQTHPADEIIVVNDCSTDGTLKILKEFEDRIMIVNLAKNTGNKSYVQEAGLKKIKTDVFIATDADTKMNKYFVERVHKAFKDNKVHAFAGYIKSFKYNWLTACREIDYLIGQDIHKVAQYNLNFLFVIPGCAGAFRTKVFKQKISFDHDTLTEDLDFTYKIHKLGLNIFYDRHAVVYTQDPDTVQSYINQVRRWYSGGWQNLLKHFGIVKDRPTKALELSMVYLEGLIFYPLMFLVPIISLKGFLYLVVHCVALGMVFGAYSAFKRKRFDLFFYSPLYILMTYINAYIFLEQFVKEVVLGKKNLKWLRPERRAIT